MAQSTRSTVYSYINVNVTIDGRVVEGMWEGDDAVQIERFVQSGNPMVGADGASINSVSASSAVRIRLRLQATSPAHRLLQQRHERFMRGLPVEFSVSIRDTGTGEGGVSSQVSFESSPNTQFGGNATSRDWVLFAQNWNETPIDYFG